MYDVVKSIFDHVWVNNDSMQQYILYCSSVLVCVLSFTFIDLVYRTFRHFWRR